MEIIFQALDIICESKLWQDKKPSEILKILLYMHNKGWLYTPIIDGKVQAVIGAYRIDEVTDEKLVKLPKDNSGKILYIPFVISLTKEDNMYEVVRSAMREYLKENTDIEEIILEDKKNNIKRYKIGDKYGEE